MGERTSTAQQQPKQCQLRCSLREGRPSLGWNKDSFPPPPLPVYRTGKWCMDLVNGALSHLSSSEISSFQRRHLPLTMLHPASCGPAPASGRRLAEGGEESWKESELLVGKSFHLSPVLSSSCSAGAFHSVSALVPARSLFFSPYHLCFSPPPPTLF